MFLLARYTLVLQPGTARPPGNFSAGDLVL